MSKPSHQPFGWVLSFISHTTRMRMWNNVWKVSCADCQIEGALWLAADPTPHQNNCFKSLKLNNIGVCFTDNILKSKIFNILKSEIHLGLFSFASAFFFSFYISVPFKYIYFWILELVYKLNKHNEWIYFTRAIGTHNVNTAPGQKWLVLL